MSLWSLAKDALYRFQPGHLTGWGDRAVAEQKAMGALRAMPEFQALLDTFDAEMLGVFTGWLNETDPAKLAALHSKGQAIAQLIDCLEQATTARARAEVMEAQYTRLLQVNKANHERRREGLASARGTSWASPPDRP